MEWLRHGCDDLGEERKGNCRGHDEEEGGGTTQHGEKTPKGGCRPAAGPQSKAGKLVVSGGDLTIVLWDGGLETRHPGC